MFDQGKKSILLAHVLLFSIALIIKLAMLLKFEVFILRTFWPS